MTSAYDNTLAGLGIPRTGVAQTAVNSTAASSSTLGQSDFISLMTAQLKNQDPFAPVDNTQMVAQLAQFSSVAGISEMNTTLKSIQDKLAGGSSSDALAYVGHTVLTEGDTAYPRASGGIAGAVELADKATDVNVSIQSADGNVFKTLKLGQQDKGTVEFDWDGKTESGADAGAGPFKVVTLAGNAGKSVGSTTLVWAPVSSVTIPASGPALLSLPGIGQVPTTAIRQAA